MTAVENQIDFQNPNDMKPIGQDNTHVDNVINVGVNMGAQFGAVRGVEYGVKAPDIRVQPPEVQQAQHAKPQDPQDPWANTGADQKPVMDGMEAVGHNLNTTTASMQAGAGYALGKACEMGSELFAGIGSLLSDNKPAEPAVEADAPQVAMNRTFIPQGPQPGGGLFT